jgi:peptide-methionine (S)-S-oxide reductase
MRQSFYLLEAGMTRLRAFFAACFAVAALVVIHAAMEPASAEDKTPAQPAIAIFSGGCFWCMEHPFDELDGVISTTSGYTGGHKKNPTYHEVSSGRTGHRESVKVTYDPNKVSYDKLLDVFWHNIDPLDAKGQFCDRGEQYTTAIFYLTEEQKRLAEASKAALEQGGKLGGPIQTAILPASEFYPAEDYHQDFYMKNPLKYRLYRLGCGRDRRLAEVWGKAPS